MCDLFHSNACKFTPSGGKLSIKTQLIVPYIPADTDPLVDPRENLLDVADNNQRPLSTDYLTQHDIQHGKPPASVEVIVVRIEVSDTGYGIKAQDMAQSKLFCACFLCVSVGVFVLSLSWLFSCVQSNRAREATRSVQYYFGLHCLFLDYLFVAARL